MNFDRKTSEQLQELIRGKETMVRDLLGDLNLLNTELRQRKIRKHPRDQRGRLLNFLADCITDSVAALSPVANFIGALFSAFFAVACYIGESIWILFIHALVVRVVLMIIQGLIYYYYQ
jgi:hypothetical protein